MSDIFDHDGLDHDEPLGSPGGPFRSREELESENERLRKSLRHSREENELLAELLAGQYEEGNGEVTDGAGEGEDQTESGRQSSGKRSLGRRFVVSDASIDLFEALPQAFTLDDVLDAAERLGQRSADAAGYLRAYLSESMVVQEGERFVKTGRKPYF